MMWRNMKKGAENNYISSEVLAAFLDGDATAQESVEIFDALSGDDELTEILNISRLVDAELSRGVRRSDLLPMTAMAATCDEDNYCCLECEKFVLRMIGVEFDEERLLRDAVTNGWQKEEGTALHNVGRHCEGLGLVVTRRYKATIEEVAESLDAGRQVIVAVDGGELLDNRSKEIAEDILIGQIPDHTVVVTAVNMDSKVVTIYDPNSVNVEDSYSFEEFEDAWSDSKNYSVTISTKDMSNYIPKSIDLSDVELTDDLIELREAIAENAHEVWAENRYAEGWRYGAQRDDALRLHPDMVPYSQLPEGEKEYDRKMAMDTIKLLKKLGYDLVKR